MFAHRINGSQPIRRLRDNLNRLFDDVFEELPQAGVGPWFEPTFPAVNVWEDSENVYAEAEMPGMKLENIELLIAGDELAIKGERSPADEDNTTYHRKERSAGRFSRLLRLPIDVKADGVEATLRDGILEVTMPKSDEARPRKVEVKALTN
ncbi:MAG: Hsp20/alpha crystallin family protein [Phycisphaerae bacterium]